MFWPPGMQAPDLTHIPTTPSSRAWISDPHCGLTGGGVGHPPLPEPCWMNDGVASSYTDLSAQDGPTRPWTCPDRLEAAHLPLTRPCDIGVSHPEPSAPSKAGEGPRGAGCAAVGLLTRHSTLGACVHPGYTCEYAMTCVYLCVLWVYHVYCYMCMHVPRVYVCGCVAT